MEISVLTIRLVVLLIPGIIATILVEQLIVHKPWTSFRFVVYAILLGALSYLACQLALNLVDFAGGLIGASFHRDGLRFWKFVEDPTKPGLLPDATEIFWACVAGTFLAFIASALDKEKTLSKIASRLKVSEKFGDESVFTFFLNTREVTWVWVRDEKKGLTYEGLKETFSESDDVREIVLRDVKVYNYSNSSLLYEVPAVYLAFPVDGVVIEMPPAKKQ